MAQQVRITVADALTFTAAFEETNAPATCAAFRRMLPWTSRIVHCRWSGEGCWIPLGTLDLGVGSENATSHPAPGQLLWHPAGVSETELLLAYGAVTFSSKVGQLAGNHFLTVVDGGERLAEVGRLTLWEGAQAIRFEAVGQ
jgi:uncharacterized protein DUF3830